MPHHDRHAGVTDSSVGRNESVFDDDEDAMEGAAQALREAEVEAVRPGPTSASRSGLENMSMDELRALAAKLDVPSRGAMTDRPRLIAAIRERM